MTYVLVWLAVTATAVLVAAAAVGNVRNQVTETPMAMIPTTSTTAVSTSESSVPATAADAASSATTTTIPSAGSTTTTTDAPTTTTTPSEPASTTTTTAPTTTATPAPPTTGIRSYDLIGGVVTVEVGSATVHLAGASPKSGFRMEVENSGPKKVEVEFESDSHESKFSGEFKDGEFVPEIEESDREEDEDDH